MIHVLSSIDLRVFFFIPLTSPSTVTSVLIEYNMHKIHKYTVTKENGNREKALVRHVNIYI